MMFLLIKVGAGGRNTPSSPELQAMTLMFRPFYRPRAHGALRCLQSGLFEQFCQSLCNKIHQGYHTGSDLLRPEGGLLSVLAYRSHPAPPTTRPCSPRPTAAGGERAPQSWNPQKGTLVAEGLCGPAVRGPNTDLRPP